MYPCSVFEVGGGMLHACQPSFIRTETPSFWRLTSVSFEGHIEKEKMEYILLIMCSGVVRIFCGEVLSTNKRNVVSLYPVGVF